VVDALNARVLIWDSLTESSSAPAVVLGASSMTATAILPWEGFTTSHFSGLCLADNRLAVADTSGNRVFVWNSVPTSSNTAPDFVLGQNDLASKDANKGGAASSSSLSSPYGLYCNDSILIVADQANNRLLIWDGPISGNGQAANRVLGQANFTDTTTNATNAATLSTLRGPRDVHKRGNLLAVADTTNNRVLLYDFSAFTGTGGTATLALGQTTTSGTNASLSATRMAGPQAVHISADAIYVAETSNNRVGVWRTSTDPLTWSTGRSMDFVLGQTSFVTKNSNDSGTTLSTMNFAHSVFSQGTKLFAVDSRNNRILWWDNAPVATGEAADGWWGQAVSTSSNISDSAISPASLFGPNFHFALDGTRLIMSEHGGHSLRFFDAPFSNGASHSFLWGQTADEKRTFNNTFVTNPTNLTLRQVRGVNRSMDGKLLVADRNNNRVLVFNSTPASNLDAPALVLGQGSFTTASTGTSATTLSGPVDVCATSTKLFVSDQTNHRILVWNTFPNTNAQAADLVLGQVNLNSGQENQGGAVTASTLSSPEGLYCDETTLAVADHGNSRVLIWTSLPTTTAEPADIVLGQRDFTSSSSNQGLSAPSASTLSYPKSVTADTTSLYVNDYYNQRIVKFDRSTLATSSTASAQFGQSSLQDSGCNSGGEVTFRSLCAVSDIYVGGDWLFIGDGYNERVLVVPKF
jgi:hypothetical protein